ncbi:hypothetical protein CC1G_13843 [Coprinopsis cinerea okayama7|uniref:Uncharacterized protein n=1 Tax=Coprinopsis cinerea (strain Okayama-7 / 130 / ATCC MYA-4618 / FGSC 9003) TaxID=240176 RepID=D6RKK5_COPC7|nr:hypothetical protein CC1G_13843 [Coprinopsis cinerea okayama7\|eukprot:XP_002911808.1 hypothetical protein CC1G_13843 [Coprinopsis cinerea okayama7\
MSGTRWVLLDDSDSRINYEGDWYIHSDRFVDSGSSGPTYQGSQHATTGSASLTFRFTGTRIRLLGTSAITNTTGTVDPSWECFVDGRSIGAEDPFPTHQNNWPLCLAPTLSDEEHVLTLNVTSSGTPFYFDQIKYLPSMSAPPSDATVVIEQSDPTITFLPEESWVNVNESAKSTSEVGAGLSVSFTGTKLTWIGWILEGSGGDSSGTYSIDDGPDTAFTIRRPAPIPGSLFFQPLFETEELPLRTHNLSVKFNGPTRTPLALDHFLVENGDIFFPFESGEQPADEPIPTEIEPEPSPTKTPSSEQSEATPVGAIVGGAVGGVALIALFAIAIFLLRRRMKIKLPPVPVSSLGHDHQPRRYPGPRESFAEAMVRKPSDSYTRSMEGTEKGSLHPSSITSGSIPAYIPVYSKYPNHSSIYIPEDDPEPPPPIPEPATRLQPLRRNMVVQNTIQE